MTGESIWTYKDSGIYTPNDFFEGSFAGFHKNYLGAQQKFRGSFPLHPCCIYCGAKLEQLRSPANLVQVCQTCGWWAVTHHWSRHYGEEEPAWFAKSACGRLANLDVNDLSTPIDELTNYLIAKYGERIDVHPRNIELIVASIFRSAGYEVRTTAYSRDNGIDLYIFDGPDDSIAGVQVKRYKRKIEAEEIRSFAGALILNGLEHGIYVTTGEYRSGALKLPEQYSQRGLSIELWDAKRLYDALRIRKSLPYSSAIDPDAPFARFVSEPHLLKED